MNSTENNIENTTEKQYKIKIATLNCHSLRKEHKKKDNNIAVHSFPENVRMRYTFTARNTRQRY
jgi:hypothetical protein